MKITYAYFSIVYYFVQSFPLQYWLTLGMLVELLVYLIFIIMIVANIN
jgi:hypothetical protein